MKLVSTLDSQKEFERRIKEVVNNNKLRGRLTRINEIINNFKGCNISAALSKKINSIKE